MFQDVTHEHAAGSHVVQFYENDSLLADNLCRLIVGSFEKSKRVIIVATSSRRLEIERTLAARGIDVPAARARNQYVDPDAALTLSSILVNAQPDPANFNSVIGGLIADTPGHCKGVWIFGEMVALLWDQGMYQAALRLESMWNDLVRTHAFALHCVYPSRGFSGHAHERPSASGMRRAHTACPAGKFLFDRLRPSPARDRAVPPGNDAAQGA